MDGDTLGVVSDQAVVADAVAQVERRGTEILGHDYQVEGQIGYDFTLSLRSELTQPDQVENYFLEQLSQVADGLRRYQVSVNGVAVGSVEEMGALESVLDQLKGQYVNENTISAEFVDDIQVEDVYSEEGQMTARSSRPPDGQHHWRHHLHGGEGRHLQRHRLCQRHVCQRPEGAESGHRYQPTDDRGRAQCEGADPSAVGDHGGRRDLYRAHRMPGGGGEGLQHVCGGLEDPDPGYRGEAQVHAQVTYVNGSETQREILSSTTLREPTTTVKAVGTKEKPKTASTGSYSWPIRGRITSYFGGRNIFGSYSYHSGIDISAPTVRPSRRQTAAPSPSPATRGAMAIWSSSPTTTAPRPITAITLPCWSAGQKVYKGQQIAKAGSTGRSTGTHCHFEVRVNGTSVNPLSYLS